MVNDLCDVTLIDEKKVREILSTKPSDPTIQHLGDFFKIIGDATRLKIILSLAKAELCVCDLAVIIGVSPSAVSHQLRILRGARIVKYRREGKTVYYSLDDLHVEHLLEDALNHLEER
jgi:ArsR family transcriptional regulator